MTLIQRFGLAPNPKVHFHGANPPGDLRSCKSAILPICHMLFMDGVYATKPWGKSRFHRTNAPDQQELSDLVHTISHPVAGYPEREGTLERDVENGQLAPDEGLALNESAHSVIHLRGSLIIPAAEFSHSLDPRLTRATKSGNRYSTIPATVVSSTHKIAISAKFRNSADLSG